jgi:heat shock protein HspQ
VTADLQFRGWQRSASEALIHAVTDDDPAHVVQYVAAAKLAADNAIEVATNPRQVAAAESLKRAAEHVEMLAQHPEQM